VQAGLGFVRKQAHCINPDSKRLQSPKCLSPGLLPLVWESSSSSVEPSLDGFGLLLFSPIVSG
jgi:hypothetical protein